MKYEINNPVSTSFTFKASLKTYSDQSVQKNVSSCQITNEETRGLTGVVAKTRALFETNLNSQNFSTPQINTIKKSVKPFCSIQASRLKNSILIPVENELDKENSIQDKLNQTPIKSILRHKDNYSQNKFDDNRINPTSIKKSISINRITGYSSEDTKPRDGLNSANIVINKCEEISKELNIPMSVKQAKACFENLTQNFNTPQLKSTLKNYSNKARANFTDLSKISNINLSEENPKIETGKNDAIIPDILNSLTSSSSSTASESSVFNNSSNSSCENTPRLIEKKKAYNKSTKVADRIKKLEESNCFNEKNLQSSLPSSSSCSNSSTHLKTQNSLYSKSSKFINLYQKQMEINTPNYRKLEDIINEADQNIALSKSKIDEKQEKKLKSILRKGPKNESIVVSEINIETKSTIRSSSCSSSSPSCSPLSSFSSLPLKQSKQKIETTKENIDNSSCMVPSKIRERAQSLDIGNSQETNFCLNNVSKMNNSFTVGIIKTPSKSVGSYIKNSSSYSSGYSNSGVVKRVTRSATNAREALIRWCRKMTEEYPNVSISNFSSSWSDGLAFCALIHHFMPNEFDYSNLNAENPRYNFDLAFKTAENKAGIVPLLDVDDMIEMGNSPDWKCVFTYVHSIYQRFKETC